MQYTDMPAVVLDCLWTFGKLYPWVSRDSGYLIPVTGASTSLSLSGGAV